jgi:hypothetical protein
VANCSDPESEGVLMLGFPCVPGWWCCESFYMRSLTKGELSSTVIIIILNYSTSTIPTATKEKRDRSAWAIFTVCRWAHRGTGMKERSRIRLRTLQFSASFHHPGQG